MKKLAILASGQGTNAENIYKFFARGNRVRVDIVIYDRRNAGVAERMKRFNVPTVYLPREVWTERPSEIVDILNKRGIDLIVLAGFLRYVPSEITHAFEGRILNIHPSLLPAHGGPGMYGHKVHEAVIDAGDTKSGVTVHYVSDIMDGGEIIMQQEVPVYPDDTPETLEQRIHPVEYSLYPRAITWALRRLDERESAAEANRKPTDDSVDAVNIPTADADHKPIDNPTDADREWADVLGVRYDPEKYRRNEPPQIPGVTPPAIPATPAQGSRQADAHAAFIAHGANGPHVSSDARQQDYPKMPDTYLVWAVLMTILCCLPAGIVAIIFSSQVSSRFYAGDIEGAEKASERAQIWIIVSFVLGVMANTLYLPLSLLF